MKIVPLVEDELQPMLYRRCEAAPIRQRAAPTAFSLELNVGADGGVAGVGEG